MGEMEQKLFLENSRLAFDIVTPIMGDSEQKLSLESYRLQTFPKESSLDGTKNKLAKAGFYFINDGHIVKCFNCSLELDATILDSEANVANIHRRENPDCVFISNVFPLNGRRSKKFASYDSLKYEKNRLETFIEWPIPMLSPRDLAANGFYYLRREDHCACIFCRGIIGAWEIGDYPNFEHNRHFPDCPFLRGEPVGNVDMECCYILDKLPLPGEESPIQSSPRNTQPFRGRLMSGSYLECGMFLFYFYFMGLKHNFNR